MLGRSFSESDPERLVHAVASLRPRAGHAAMCSGVFLGLGRATELLSAMPPASPFASMTRAVSLQWTARCARTIPREGLRVVEPLRHQDDGNWIS